MPEARIVEIRGEFITLGQLLKKLGLVTTGGQVARFLVQAQVLINGEPDTRRGRKVRPGDQVQVGATLYRCVAAGSDRADS